MFRFSSFDWSQHSPPPATANELRTLQRRFCRPPRRPDPCKDNWLALRRCARIHHMRLELRLVVLTADEGNEVFQRAHFQGAEAMARELFRQVRISEKLLQLCGFLRQSHGNANRRLCKPNKQQVHFSVSFVPLSPIRSCESMIRIKLVSCDLLQDLSVFWLPSSYPSCKLKCQPYCSGFGQVWSSDLNSPSVLGSRSEAGYMGVSQKWGSPF